MGTKTGSSAPPSSSALRVAIYASDPPAIDAFHSFDPDSFVCVGLIADTLIYIDVHGHPAPGLALSWEQTAPDELVLQLRRDVRFHDGSAFDARDVVASFDAYTCQDNPTVTGQTGLASLRSVEALDPLRVRVRSCKPDPMLPQRMFLFNVYSRIQLEAEGIGGVRRHPIGTGAYRFREWVPGSYIRLERNREHWSGHAGPEVLKLPFVPRAHWADRVASGQIDVALDVDATEITRMRNVPSVRTFSREAAVQNYFLLSERGPLAHPMVRKALNLAVNSTVLAQIADGGGAEPQSSLCNPGEPGFCPSLAPYAFDPIRASELLELAGYREGFELRGLVASSCMDAYLAARAFLAQVGVKLEAEVVPRSELNRRIVTERAMSGVPFEGDFYMVDIDNPLAHGAFPLFNMATSQGAFSLVNDPELDAMYDAALAEPCAERQHAALARMEQEVRDRALYLQTSRRRVHAIARFGIELTLPHTGHFDTDALWGIRDLRPAQIRPALAPPQTFSDEQHQLLAAVRHPGWFDLHERYQDPFLAELVRSLKTHQDYVIARTQPVLDQLVVQARSSNQLRTLNRSTHRVGIVVLTRHRKVCLVNAGFETLVGDREAALQLRVAGEHFECLKELPDHLDRWGSWSGPVALSCAKQLHLDASRSTDEFGEPDGYTFVLSDFSGEQERARSQAIRKIMDHVAIGLFSCGPDGRVHEGWSRACHGLFGGGGVTGRAFWELLELDPSTVEQLWSQLEQLFEDVLPERLVLRQLPERLQSRDKTLALSGSVIRDDDGTIEAVQMSLVDVTELVAAEREIGRIKGVMAVMRRRDTFRTLSDRFFDRLTAWCEGWDVEQEPAIRRALHTFKGEFATFGQWEIVELIHQAEGEAHLRSEHMVAMKDLHLEGLERNQPYWNIVPGQEEVPRVPCDLLQDFADTLAPEEARRLRQLIASATHPMVWDRIGPMASSAEQLAAQQGKHVRVEVVGAELRAPASLNPIFSALTHLVLNAIDHGLEPSHQRGTKPSEGYLKIEVGYEEGVAWWIRVEDDGRGIDDMLLLDKAVRTGLVDVEWAETATEADRLALVFRDGLSSKETATHISGRGVGMAALAEAVTELGGYIGIQSTLGEGTRFDIHIPAAAAHRANPAPLWSRTS